VVGERLEGHADKQHSLCRHCTLLLLRDKSRLCHLIIDFIEDIEIDYPDDYKR
jgi:hypothetical protein